MTDRDEQILAASNELRDLHERRKAALASIDSAKATVAEREREAEAALKELKAAELRLRELASGESSSITYRERRI